jgi:hypothetical protein
MTDGGGLAPFFRLERFDAIDSTNEECKRRAARGAPEGTLIWAGAQTAGRGRRGRVWVSVPGNLYMSLLLRPERGAAAAAQLGFAAALAVGEAATALLPAALFYSEFALTDAIYPVVVLGWLLATHSWLTARSARGRYAAAAGSAVVRGSMTTKPRSPSMKVTLEMSKPRTW